MNGSSEGNALPKTVFMELVLKRLTHRQFDHFNSNDKAQVLPDDLYNFHTRRRQHYYFDDYLIVGSTSCDIALGAISSARQSYLVFKCGLSDELKFKN